MSERNNMETKNEKKKSVPAKKNVEGAGSSSTRFITVGGTLLRPSLIYYVTGDKDKDGCYQVAYENDMFSIDDCEKSKLESILCGQMKDKGWISVDGTVINVNRIMYISPNPEPGKEGKWILSYSNEIFDITAEEKDSIIKASALIADR